MKIHHLTAEEALESLDSSRHGLCDAVIRERLHKYSFNRIEETQKESKLLAFIKEFLHFFAQKPKIASGFG